MTKRLMSPIEINGLELPNRTLMPAMQLNLTPAGEMTDAMVDFAQRCGASAGPGPRAAWA